MKKHFIHTITVLIIALPLMTASAQTIKTPAASPLQTVTQSFGLGEIKIEYSRPGVKGRVVFGDLVPYNQAWRTGANGSTKLTVGDDIKLNGTPLASGTYALYTIPSQAEWDVILSKDLTIGANVADYKPADEVMRFKVKPVMMNDKMETFTIQFNNVTSSSCSLDLVWDKIKVSIPINTEIDAKIQKQIDKDQPQRCIEIFGRRYNSGFALG